jgi:hypothetical protein
MDSTKEAYSAPRSGTGFVLALALALFTFWGAGLVLQLHSLVVDPPIQRAAAATSPAPDCATESYGTGSCDNATRQ